MGLIGFPINAILDWPMGTLAGYLFVLDSQVNIKWQGILITWGQFLTTSCSMQCLNQEKGWLSTNALNLLAAKGNNGKTKYIFQQLYACDPTLPSFGFGSWDAFFTRKFNPVIRIVSGTYYSENLYQGFINPDWPDPNASNNSQPYISAVATRGIIFIQADNPIIYPRVTSPIACNTSAAEVNRPSKHF